jgi:hypothetical protein
MIKAIIHLEAVMQKQMAASDVQILTNVSAGSASTITLITPILPGKAEAWRRFVQEILEVRRAEYEESRRRLGITGERAWIAETLHAAVAIITIDTCQPEQLITQLAASDLPFDCWLREQLLTLQGIDLTKVVLDLVLDWRKPEV